MMKKKKKKKKKSMHHKSLYIKNYKCFFLLLELFDIVKFMIWCSISVIANQVPHRLSEKTKTRTSQGCRCNGTSRSDSTRDINVWTIDNIISSSIHTVY